MKKTSHPGLYRLPDGRYKIRATAKCERTGKLREATRTLEPGVRETEALAVLYQMKIELKQGGAEEAAAPTSVPSVTDYAEQWLERKARRIRPSVAVNYERALGNAILPQLGHHALDQVHRGLVEDWVTWAERQVLPDGRPYARDTVQGWWRVLKALLRDCAAEYNLPDPTNRVRPPEVRITGRRERGTLTGDELARLLGAVEALFPERHPEVHLLAFTGVRAGELYALTWDDIDDKAGVIHVRRSVWKGQVAATKTGDPRDVAVNAAMLEVLRRHRERMVAAWHPGVSTGLVFPANNGAHREPQSLHKPLAVASEAAGLGQRVTAQVLRRTFNTLMVVAGVDRIVLRSVMGHCSEEMTARYAGVGLSAKQEALEQLSEGVRL